MKKESMGLGIRKSCPACKKIVFKGLKFDGNFLEEAIKCPHCSTQLFRSITKKTLVTLTKLSIVLLFILGVYIGVTSHNSQNFVEK